MTAVAFINSQQICFLTSFVCSFITIVNLFIIISDLVNPIFAGSAGSRSYLAGISYSFDSSNSPFCAGSLISSQWILTTASCSYSDSTKTAVDKVKVVLGEETLGTPDEENFKVGQPTKNHRIPSVLAGCECVPDHSAPQLLPEQLHGAE